MGNYSIKIKNFSKSFGGVKVVDNLSFDVNEGDIFAFLGSNGSGKTTTIRCLLKIYEADEGDLLINNEPYSEKFNNLIGYLPEERGLYRDVSVIDMLVYTATLRGIDNDDAIAKSLSYLEKVGLIDHMKKNVGQLSSGMQQKVQLGTALIHNPEILILDEPFKGLDPVNRQLFVEILMERASKGTTILYSTHVIDEAQKMADGLVIIKNGKRLEYGTVSEVRERHGSDNIHLEFNGKQPLKEGKTYTSIVSNKFAELKPKDGFDTNAIMMELINNGTKIIDLKVDYPSLNQVFMEVNK